MISDIDQEMKNRRLSGLIVIGDSTFGNPELFYVVGANLPRGGVYVKPRAQPPILVVSNIDVGSAQEGRVGQIETYSEYGYERTVAKYGGSKARNILIHEVLRKHRLKGRIGLYGKSDVSQAIASAEFLRKKNHKIVGENPPTLLDSLRETKDEIEVSRIRDVGRRTERIVEETIRFLRDCRSRGDELLYEGQPLTTGRVKAMIRRFSAEEDVMNTHDVIFAVGPNSADPHYRGMEQDPVRPGQPIVFDIFPQEPGGYWFDTTRTYVIGKASEEIKSMHEAVLEAQLTALDKLRAGIDGKIVTGFVCDVFERRGYKTQRDLVRGEVGARTTGFIHSLGHGVGLTIGERPNLSVLTSQILREGHVSSVEPGLYKPGVGGVRIEDIAVIRKQRIENLSTLDKTLEI
ncbi:MAG: Xaa-Pro peptidase family protein [archaeon]